MSIQPLKNAIKELHSEHLKNEDFDGFLHDLSVLISEGLGDDGHYSLNLEEMTEHFTDYVKELKSLA